MEQYERRLDPKDLCTYFDIQNDLKKKYLRLVESFR